MQAKANKVVHLTSVHPYNDPRIFHKQCASLAKAGFHVVLICAENNSFVENHVEVQGVGKWKNRWHRLFLTVPKILQQAFRSKAKLFHIHDPELLLIVPFLRAAGAQVIYDIHEDYTTSVLQKHYLPRFVRKLSVFWINIIEKAENPTILPVFT